MFNEIYICDKDVISAIIVFRLLKLLEKITTVIFLPRVFILISANLLWLCKNICCTERRVLDLQMMNTVPKESPS
jgi:hypothetical protein